MSWVCYLLLCSDDTLYCGITNDIDARLVAHNTGVGAKYTRGRIPVQLVHVELCPDKSSALKREFKIKQFSRAQKKNLYSTKL